MKKTLLATAFVGFGLLSTGAFASDGSITINGKITGTTCDIDIGGAGADGTVTLPTVSTSALSAAEDVAGKTLVKIDLTNCSDTGSVRAFFNTTNVNSSTGNLLNIAATGTPATNVEVQLLNKTQGVIDLRTNDTNPYETITGDAATLEYYAQYIAKTAAAGEGDVSTKAVFSLDYQ
ncbi:fimbrial protein [Buttiauxella selenatireducens]|uniref:Fimbrial protein n=1 Tax=Buttiauxella selenatireducens TaxID=3073902 RepID=A0ABY9SET7_9ENTR|nr:fimbrial protein [Buttiauxella sp. R73]WMY75942.1 fimbrial protein [Buttiauxella sp. R73]